jgi:bifunctional UDP-N-acetylglucosamine pyrophosphorylase/glucosamine-1-phosphate N-acetyltransferase
MFGRNSGINSVVVVGIKAPDVMQVIGNRERTQFAYQEIQKGTGHAVQVGLERIDETKFMVLFLYYPGIWDYWTKEQ